MAETPITVSSLNLEARGKRLFKEMRAKYSNMDPIQIELLVEACRIVDQLEKLHDIERGNKHAWAFLKMPRNAGTIQVEIDGVVDKQRQLQLALKQITATLTVAGESGAQTTGGVTDELAARAERRRTEERARLTPRGTNSAS